MSHGQCTDKCQHVESRKKWPPGPWHNEPDRVEFIHAGLNCLLHRARGHWCGYVGLPASHPLHGKGYGDNGVDRLDVHGGVTYAEVCQGAVCHVPAEGEDEELWWLGFDCAHAWDRDPDSMARGFDCFDGYYKDEGFVTRETQSLAEQLAAFADPQPA
jgi:hypothetical protein